MFQRYRGLHGTEHCGCGNDLYGFLEITYLSSTSGGVHDFDGLACEGHGYMGLSLRTWRIVVVISLLCCLIPSQW
jgi:hypothetical protein